MAILQKLNFCETMNIEKFFPVLRIKIYADLVHQEAYICKKCYLKHDVGKWYADLSLINISWFRAKQTS